ncbi:MAG: DUF1810 domain-containing protein [Thermoleophilia bacterium]
MDEFQLDRFLVAQEGVFERALAEIESGCKRGHWIWFIFPQYKGLGRSAMSERYALRSLEEARAYLHHAELGPRLTVCAEAALAAPGLSAEGLSAEDIFGRLDAQKVHACATLFGLVAGPHSVFHRLIDRFYGGLPHERTLALLERDRAERDRA